MTLRSFTLLFVLGGLLAVACDAPPEQQSSDVLDATEQSCGLLVCAQDELCCDYICVSTHANPDHCGACGITCSALETCTSGTCVCGDTACAPGASCCEQGGQASCTSTTSPFHCGGCGITCDPDELCFQGLCACRAAEGQLEACTADETCCPGLGCLALDYDPLSCGACGVQCGAGEQCIDGQCTCGNTPSSVSGPACDQFEVCCGSPATCKPTTDPECRCGASLCGSGQSCCDVNTQEQCISTWRDANHCGACGVACGPGQACQGGVCVCHEGLADCNNDPSDGCEVSLALDPGHCNSCNNTCPAGEICNGRGTCELTCLPGLTPCDGVCRDLASDRNHCGACNNACGPGEVANGAGECTPTCLPGYTECDSGECVRLTSNRAHCGACGQACGAGDVCDGAGSCALTCQAGFTDCAGSCVDVLSDRAHCGGCGVRCPSGEVCDGSGQCAPSCQSGYTHCDGLCVNLASNVAHCGACSAACPSGAQCIGGACETRCATGLAMCDGLCVDLNSNRTHCGGCGSACDATQRCDGGQCVANCAPGLVQCDQVCVLLDRSHEHCGACGNACASDEVCSQGVCCNAVSGCSGASEIAAGGHLSCAVSGGRLSCWGYNQQGSVGDGTTIHRSTPTRVQIPVGLRVVDVDIMASFGEPACAITEDEANGNRAIYCWGNLPFDPNSIDTRRFPTPFDIGYTGLSTPEQLALGDNFGCVRALDGSVHCWAQAATAILGPDFRETSAPSPVRVAELPPVIDIAAGSNTMCALTAGLEVWCWGSPGEAAIECGGANTCPKPTPVLQEGTQTPLTGVQSLSGGREHFCAITDAGDGVCWGFGYSGQLGDASCDPNIDPDGCSRGVNLARTVTTTSKWVKISAGEASTCGITTTGGVLCWGYNYEGILGRGCAPNLETSCPDTGLTPEPVIDASGTPLSNIVDLDTGQYHVCALRADGALLCWGDNGNFAIGIDELGPLDLLDATRAASSLDVYGVGGLLCAVLADGTGVICWGNTLYDLGFPTSPEPTLIASSDGIVEVSAGRYFACGRYSDGRVSCWGDAFGDKLGSQPTDGYSFTPLAVPAFDGASAAGRAAQVEAGSTFACALTEEGGVGCWGTLSAGLGNGTHTTSLTPVAVTGLTERVEEVSLGTAHACVRTATGAVWCWGDNRYGQLGDGTPSASGVPAAVAGLDGSTEASSAVAISAGSTGTCAVLEDGRVWCWGRNNNGQLGDGTTTDATTPVEAVGIGGSVPKAAAISYGSRHTCAVLMTGAVWCWGYGASGQHGNGAFDDVLEPGPAGDVDGITLSAADVDVTDKQTCALLTDGRVRCWGRTNPNGYYDTATVVPLTP